MSVYRSIEVKCNKIKKRFPTNFLVLGIGNIKLLEEIYFILTENKK